MTTTTLRKAKFLLTAICSILFVSTYGQVIYVNHAATGADDGSSWADAYTDLQSALDLRMSNQYDTIKVASGTYYPTESPDGTTSDIRDRAFHLADSTVKIIGGYNASTGIRTSTPTILSGYSDSCYHVFITQGLSRDATFEYLTFLDGDANGSTSIIFDATTYDRDVGGGLYNAGSSPAIKYCRFIDNTGYKGAGVYNYQANPKFNNCTFSANIASFGGGIYNDNSSDIECSRSLFQGNVGSAKGGAICSETNSNSIFTNCLIYNNTAPDGAGIYDNSSSGSTLTNVSFIINNASNANGGALMAENTSNPTLISTLFYDNEAATSPTAINLDGTSGLTGSSTNNASDADVSTISAVGSGFVDLTTKYYIDLFYDSTDMDGFDNLSLTRDDGISLASGSVLLAAGKVGGGPSLDITSFTRPSNPSIGAYEGGYCGTSNALPTTANTTYTSAYKSVASNGWTHFCSSDDKLLLSLLIGSSGAIVKEDEVELKLGSSSTYGYGSSGGMVTNSAGYEMIDRIWEVNPTTGPTSDVGVRFYYTSSEYSSLVSALSTHSPSASIITSDTQLNVFKSNTSSPFAYPHTTTGTVLFHGSTPSVDIWNAGTIGSNHVAEYEVASFVGGGSIGGGGGNNPAASPPLPVELLHFIARKEDDRSVLLSWATASELNNDYFAIERSYDGINFDNIAQVKGYGNANHIIDYSYLDNRLSSNATTLFYRLIQTDFDGEQTPSGVRRINLNDNAQNDVAQIYPNPIGKSMYVKVNDDVEEDLILRVSTLAGQVKFEIELNTNKTLNIDMSSLRAGAYIVTISGPTTYQVKRIIKKQH